MNSFFNRFWNFFHIDNPLLIAFLLLIIVLSRFSVSYFNDSHHFLAPEIGRYSGGFIGHDFIIGTTDQAYRLLNGIPPQLSIGYGYGITILTAWDIELMNSFGFCSQTGHISCQFLLYRLEVILSIAGFLFLLFLLVKDNLRRAIAIIFLIAFYIGIPGGMGIESGNLDIVLSVMYGFMLYLQKNTLNNKKQILYSLLLGIIAGIMIQTKLFVLPIIVIFLLFSKKPLYFSFSFLITFIAITVIPEFYNIPSNPLAVIQGALNLAGNQNLYEGVVYSNNSTKAMMGGLVFAIPLLYSNPSLQKFLINIGGMLLLFLVLLAPIFTVYKKMATQIKKNFTTLSQYPFFIVANCCVISSIILWPDVSLDYRFFYFIPLIFILIDSVKTDSSKKYLGLALSFLIIRSAYIMHARILHIFLLAFIYFLILTSLYVWLDNFENKAYPKQKRLTGRR